METIEEDLPKIFELAGIQTRLELGLKANEGNTRKAGVAKPQLYDKARLSLVLVLDLVLELLLSRNIRDLGCEIDDKLDTMPHVRDRSVDGVGELSQPEG